MVFQIDMSCFQKSGGNQRNESQLFQKQDMALWIMVCGIFECHFIRDLLWTETMFKMANKLAPCY